MCIGTSRDQSRGIWNWDIEMCSEPELSLGPGTGAAA